MKKMDADFSCCNYKLLQGTLTIDFYTTEMCSDWKHTTDNLFCIHTKGFLFSNYVFTRAKPKEKDFLFF